MKANILITGGIGGLIGVILTVLVIFTAMPSMMLKTNEVTMSYDETVQTLQDRIKDKRWVLSGVKEVNKSLAKEGVDFKHRVTLVSLCHPKYAESILTSDRYMSVMMPCNSVYGKAMTVRFT